MVAFHPPDFNRLDSEAKIWQALQQMMAYATVEQSVYAIPVSKQSQRV